MKSLAEEWKKWDLSDDPELHALVMKTIAALDTATKPEANEE